MNTRMTPSQFSNFLLWSSLLWLTGCSSLPSEPRFTNSVGMEFVRIEPGEFMMGESVQPLPEALFRPLSYPTLAEMERRFPVGESDRYVVNLDHVRNGDPDEKPVHRVRITEPFYMGVYEVTNAQFEQFAADHQALRGKKGFSSEDDEAVVFVSWEEARAFCEWLSEKEGRSYRLPTEAEWEFACRAGTDTVYNTGNELPESFHKNQRRTSFTDPETDVVSLRVGQSSPNAWGLHDMHGNVEEWTRDWYGPYDASEQEDPVGRSDGAFKVTRGGSHGTNLYFLRSANRSGTLPENRNWLIGFRVVLGEEPGGTPLPPSPPSPTQEDVNQEEAATVTDGYDPEQPYFKGPRKYVKIPPDSQGPVFSHHNHDPAIVACPNGDLLAIWYSCVEERGRELSVAASRLRRGADEWDEASLFWDAPDRNDHCPALWFDGQDTLYHFNGLSVAGMWEPLAIVMRTSKDSGASWSKAQLIVPDHGYRQMVGEPVFRTDSGAIVFGTDAGDGSTIWISRDEGETWTDSGGTINGIHAGIVQLEDGRLMALGRGMNIDGFMPKSISEDMGESWTASKSPFPPLRGGQRPVLIRLKEGPLFFASFAENPYEEESAQGDPRAVTNIFAALSYDEGETWPVRRIVTNGEPDHRQETIDEGPIRMSPTSSEPQGYLSVSQSSEGIIHLISSINHYAFNLSWLQEELGNPGKWPQKKEITGADSLAHRFEATTLPTESTSPPWNFLGTGGTEETVARVQGEALRIQSRGQTPARWSNEKLEGLNQEDLSQGVSAEIQLQMLRSGSRDGVDLELFLRGGALTVNHYLLTITGNAVYYHYRGEKVPIATGMNNTGSSHTFRLAVRPDTAVQVYRDDHLLSVQPADIIIDWRAPARGSYLEWGTSDSRTAALVKRVSFDPGGAYAGSQ